MRQYNLAFHDDEQTIPCTYIIERDECTFEGFFLDNSIGMFNDVAVAARALWYITELTLWRPSPDQRKLPI
jgi:hypothetical protein